VFDLASVTKPTFTAAAVMFLLNDGTISDEDYIVQYIPEFGQQGKGDVKIKHCLTHSSGLAAYTNTTGLPPRPNPDALIERICGLPKQYVTGEGYIYSCLNFIILARVVENVTGETVTNFLRRRLWDEIGMVDSTHFPTAEQITRTAPTLLTESRRGTVHDPLAYYYTDYVNQTHCCGNAGGFSTVRDEARLCRLLLHKGTLYHKPLVRPEVVRPFTTLQSSAGWRTYGWQISGFSTPLNFTDDTYCIAHSGYTGTLVWIDQLSKTYVVLFSNYVYPDDNSARKARFQAARNEAIYTLIDHIDVYNGVAEEAVVVDDDAGTPNVTLSGAWTPLAGTGYMDKDEHRIAAGAQGQADFRLSIPGAGRYRLKSWQSSASGLSDQVRFVVRHRGGETGVTIDQSAYADAWAMLGDFDFDAGDSILTLDAAASGGTGEVAADAIQVECLRLDTDIVVDNEDPGYSDTANFFSSSASPYRYGATYRACNPGEGDSATWQLDIPRDGIYEVCEWHNGNSTRSPAAPFTVTSVAGAETVFVNEQENSGQWNLLGRFAFREGGGIVRLDSVADNIVIADAIRVRRVDYEIIVDDLDGRYSDTAGFAASHDSPLLHDATYRTCPTGSGESAQWNIQVPYPGIWALYEWHNGSASCSDAAPFTIAHAHGTQTVFINQQERGGEWVPLGSFVFREGEGSVIVSNECGGGDSVVADGIRAVFVGFGYDSSGLYVH
jgi:CubicO group peptidase (beta-lactamase class C family)